MTFKKWVGRWPQICLIELGKVVEIGVIRVIMLVLMFVLVIILGLETQGKSLQLFNKLIIFLFKEFSVNLISIIWSDHFLVSFISNGSIDIISGILRAFLVDLLPSLLELEVLFLHVFVFPIILLDPGLSSMKEPTPSYSTQDWDSPIVYLVK